LQQRAALCLVTNFWQILQKEVGEFSTETAETKTHL